MSWITMDIVADIKSELDKNSKKLDGVVETLKGDVVETLKENRDDVMEILKEIRDVMKNIENGISSQNPASKNS